MGKDTPPNEGALRGMDREPDFSEDLERLKGLEERFRQDCEGILDRLGLRYLLAEGI